MSNQDTKTVSGFGDEWSRFDQTGLTTDEHENIFQDYFGIFPWGDLPDNATGFDLGCGSGRWAIKAAERVNHLHLVDASDDALNVAKKNLANRSNVNFHHASVDAIPLEDNSMDFGYSLGVLHHVPNTAQGIRDCTRKLKPGAPFLIYLYYAFDNRPAWYRMLWKMSELLRAVISRMPHFMRYIASQIMAVLLYLPFATLAKLVRALGGNHKNIPLNYYADTSFYTMRTDALDRLGTRLEQRFTKVEIQQMLEDAGLTDIKFSDKAPFWVAVGKKK